MAIAISRRKSHPKSKKYSKEDKGGTTWISPFRSFLFFSILSVLYVSLSSIAFVSFLTTYHTLFSAVSLMPVERRGTAFVFSWVEESVIETAPFSFLNQQHF